MGPTESERRNSSLSSGLPRHRLGGLGTNPAFYLTELPRRRLGNLSPSFSVGQVEAPHVFEIALRKPASELRSQTSSKFTKNFLAILSSISPALFFVYNPTADFIVRLDLKQIESAGCGPTR